MNYKSLLQMRRVRWLLFFLIWSIASIATSAPQQSKATSLPEIGDDVVSKDGSLQIKVLEVTNTDSVTGKFDTKLPGKLVSYKSDWNGNVDLNIKPKQGFSILLITLELKNISDTNPPTLLLGSKHSTVKDIQGRLYPFEDMGIVTSDWPVFLASGALRIAVGAWDLETDTTGKLRLISIPVGKTIKLLLVYFVPKNSKNFTLSMPAFRSIKLQDLKPSQTSASTTKRETTLYLCHDQSNRRFLSEECELSGGLKFFFYPPEFPRGFVYILQGDISGTTYRFNLLLSSRGATVFEAAVILEKHGKEEVIASTSFTAKSPSFETFSETIVGLDPTTAKGDTMIFRITAKSGAEAALMDASSSGSSFVTIPLVK